MGVVSRLRVFASAATIALLAFGLAHPASAASDGDFVNVRGDGAATISSPAYGQVPVPWSEAWFQAEFPDLLFAREAYVELSPVFASDPKAGHGGAAHPNAKASGGIGAPKITIKRRPGL